MLLANCEFIGNKDFFGGNGLMGYNFLDKLQQISVASILSVVKLKIFDFGWLCYKYL